MAINGALIRSKPFKVTAKKAQVTDPDGEERIGITFDIERNVQPTDRYNSENLEFITEQEYNDLGRPSDLPELTKYSERIQLRFDITDENGNSLEEEDQQGGVDLIKINNGNLGTSANTYEFIYYSYLNE